MFSWPCGLRVPLYLAVCAPAGAGSNNQKTIWTRRAEAKFSPIRNSTGTSDPDEETNAVSGGATESPFWRVTVLVRGANVTEVACRIRQRDNAAKGCDLAKFLTAAWV